MPVYKGEPTKDGRMWFFQVRKKDINGNNKIYKSKKYLTKKEAIQEEAIFISKKHYSKSEKFSVVAECYFKEFKEKRREVTHYTNYRLYKHKICPYFGEMDINSINVSHIKQWHEIMDKNDYKISYKRKTHIILSSILNYAMINYGLKVNMASLVGNFEEPTDAVIKDENKLRYITIEDFNKFISVIDDIKWNAFFNFLFYTGMRKGEVQALTWEDIDFNKNSIKVEKNLSVKTQERFKITATKNCVNRTIIMSKHLKEIMLQYKQDMQKYTDFKESWFVFGGSRFLPQTTIDRIKHKYFEMAGVKEITIHEFRHSHVSLLINEYVKSGQTDTTKFFVMMSSRMGHTIQVMQETYLHLFPTIQNEIVDLLDNL